MNGEFHNLVPMVCDDVPTSIRFYGEILGFQVEARADNTIWDAAAGRVYDMVR